MPFFSFPPVAVGDPALALLLPLPVVAFLTERR
jgi:hypothetical protein